MFQFAWPWIAASATLPLLVAWLAPPAHHSAGAALRLPFYRAVIGLSAHGVRRGVRASTWLAVLAWACLVGAACRPQWLGDPVGMPISGRDLLLAVDISGSMKTTDLARGSYRVSRLRVVKEVAGEFIERRDGDRVGLILFGSRAYLQTPLTFDRDTVSELLGEAVIGLAGEQTAIGDAIGLAVKRLRERPDENRVMVLLTDGANTTGMVSPREAAELASLEGVRIYAIGVGADELSANALGPTADLDETTLQAITALTDGRYFRARDAEELEEIYELLDELEPVARDEEMLRPTHELFYLPLAVALAIGAALLAAVLWAGRLRHARQRLRELVLTNG